MLINHKQLNITRGRACFLTLTDTLNRQRKFHRRIQRQILHSNITRTKTKKQFSFNRKKTNLQSGWSTRASQVYIMTWNENSKYYGNAQIQIREYKIKYKRRGFDQPSLYINSDWDERSESGRRLKRLTFFSTGKSVARKYQNIIHFDLVNALKYHRWLAQFSYIQNGVQIFHEYHLPDKERCLQGFIFFFTKEKLDILKWWIINLEKHCCGGASCQR